MLWWLCTISQLFISFKKNRCFLGIGFLGHKDGAMLSEKSNASNKFPHFFLENAMM